MAFEISIHGSSNNRTEWTARLLAVTELARLGYDVSVAGDDPLEVRNPQNGSSIPVKVRGLSVDRPWIHIEEPAFFILVRIGNDRSEDQFCILSQAEKDAELANARTGRPATDTTEGFGFKVGLRYKDRWDTIVSALGRVQLQ
jgi:hypothetical protein